MNGDREKDLINAANMLLDARRTGVLLQDLPEDLRPTDMTEVYAVQDLVAAAYGTIGGWKIGAPNPETTPLFAPMPRVWIGPANSVVTGRYRGLEAEIAFLIGRDLPPRATPYTRPEVLDAMASCHPVIEELETALIDPASASRLSSLADLQMHGGFIYGAPFTEWTMNDWGAEQVSLATDGVLRVERTGSNTSGDLLGLLVYLANEGSARTGGLRAGQWITTGSWTGNTIASAGSSVDVTFSHAGSVSFHFA